MTPLLKKLSAALALPCRMLLVWMVFLAAMWITRGAAGGVPGFAIALAAAAAMWWRWSRPLPRRVLHAIAMAVAVAPLVYLLVPLAPSTLQPLAADAAIQMWATGPGREVAVYRFPANPNVPDRHRALVFVHGGPGGYIRNFDRDFFATFADDGFDVILYDQYGAGRSPIGKAADYSHDNNVRDLVAVLARVNKPTVLVAQSYGATLATSALAQEQVQRRVSHLVLTEPGKIPGAAFSVLPAMAQKTTLAKDAGRPPSAAIAAKLAAPRAMLAAMLAPGGAGYASQEEIINHYDPEVQRALISSSFCNDDRAMLDSFQPTRFNLIANAVISRQARGAPTPKLQNLAAPVLMILGECSYIPRGRAMEYFDVYRIARSHLVMGVGHIVWGNAKGQALTRAAIKAFVDNTPGPLPNEPTQASANQFVAAGR